MLLVWLILRGYYTMLKCSYYNGGLIRSYEIDGHPYASMEDILLGIVPDAWGDYSQILNSGEDMVFDLDIKCVDSLWLIPIPNVSCWLYSFSLRNKVGDTYELFRVYRRDVEKVLRATWAMHLDSELCMKECDEPYNNEGSLNAADLYHTFSMFDIPKVELGPTNILQDHSMVLYIEHVAGGTSCGPRGHLLCEMIGYIEEMPNGIRILDFIDETLSHSMPFASNHLDEFLDELNYLISISLTRFIGEL